MSASDLKNFLNNLNNMKRNTIPKAALFYLIVGLLLVSFTPIISRYVPLPDSSKGFLTGLGLMLEVIAIVKIDRSRKNKQTCRRYF